MSLLRLRGVAKRFGATVALDGVDLEVPAGRVLALVGENGAGKSTLTNVISGLVKADAGKMVLAGEPYEPRSPADARARGIVHVHQELSLCPHLSVAENVFLGTEPASHGWLRRRRLFDRAAELLREFGRGAIDPRTRTGDLSLADRQVVEICRALARKARILLMDEPTSSLSRASVARLFSVLRRLSQRGVAIVYISHFLEEVREIADRYTVLRDGRSVASGELADVRNDQLIEQMVGRAVETVFVRETGLRRAPGEVALEVRDLAVPPLLTSASFRLARGEILGIAGLIGSGRTDLVRAIFGLARPTAGSIRIRGREVPTSKSEPSRQIRSGIGYLAEDRKGEGLALQLSVADNVTMSRFSSCARAGWVDRNRQREQAQSVMRTLRVRAPGTGSKVARLSGGNQQKIAIGRLLHQDPDVLLLDEPARGIDVGSKSDIYREISRLAAGGKAVLIVSSYLPELFAVCDRIAVMSRGRLSPARPVAEWSPDEVMETAIGAAV